MNAGDAARPLTRREEVGVASRARILEAASALIAERGFAGTSISAVSKRSGLPPSSIYWHFQSKEGLLAAVVEEGARRWFEALPRPEEFEGNPLEQALQIAAAAGEALEEHPEFLRLLFLIALERREIDPDSLAVIARVRGMARTRLEVLVGSILEAAGVSEREQLAEEISVLALTMIDGIFLQHHIEPDRTDVPRMFELARSALIGLGERLVREAEDATGASRPPGTPSGRSGPR